MSDDVYKCEVLHTAGAEHTIPIHPCDGVQIGSADTHLRIHWECFQVSLTKLLACKQTCREHPGSTTPTATSIPTRTQAQRENPYGPQRAQPTHSPPLPPRHGSSNFMREQEGSRVTGLQHPPHPSCCHCQAAATGKCQGANLRREKGAASLDSECMRPP